MLTYSVEHEVLLNIIQLVFYLIKLNLIKSQIDEVMLQTSALQLHGKTYFRLEHYLPVSVLDKVNQTNIKEELPKLHSNYYGASDTEAEFEFLKVSKIKKYSF